MNLNSCILSTSALLTFLFSFICPSSLAQTVSQYVYGDTLVEEGYSIFETHDSLFISTGYTDTTDTSGGMEENVYLIKTDLTGAHIWSNGYRIISNERGYSVIENRNDTVFEYVVVGDVIITGAPKKHYDAFLLRTDTAGNVISLTRYGAARNEHARSVIAVDTGYVFVGYTNTNSNAPYDVYLVRTDLLGNQLWARNIDINSGDDYGFDIIQIDDSFYITGNTYDSLTKRSQVFLMNTDLNGNVQWVDLYGDSIADDFSYSIKETIDTGLVMIGHTFGYRSTGDSHVFVIKTDINGVSQWYGVYDFGNPDSSDFGRDILVADDSTYYGIGHSWVRNNLQLNKTIFKLDFTGNVIWVKSFGGTEEERGFAGWLLPNTVVGLGTTFSLGPNVPDAYFCRTTQTDSLECVDFVPVDTTLLIHENEIDINFSQIQRTEWVRDSALMYEIDIWRLICLDSADRHGIFLSGIPINESKELQIYPNPSTGQFIVRSPILINQRTEVEILDIAGKSVYRKFFKPAGDYILVETILSSGIYNCVIRNESGVSMDKIILHCDE